MTYTTARFGVYDYIKNEHYGGNESAMSLTEKVGISSLAGMVGVVFGAPADLTNVRMQVKMMEYKDVCTSAYMCMHILYGDLCM